MAEALIDWSKSAYQEALRLIPQRFRELACGYADEVAAKVARQSDSNPIGRRNTVETTSECALNGLTFMRWYLLFQPERAERVEAAWRDDGVVGLCRSMRELHQAERSLLVSGYGSVKPEEVDSRLSRLHEKHCFTIVAVSHGFAAERVLAWSKASGIQGIPFLLDNDRDLSSRLVGQYYRLLDMLAPAAVCVLSPDHLAMKLADCARMKGVAEISVPASPQQPRPRGVFRPPRQEPQEPVPTKRFQFSVLAGAERGDQGVEGTSP